MIPVRELVDYYHRTPVTATVKRRPVFERLLRRKHYMFPLDPPTEAEKQDAIRILADPWEDDLTEEALRILDEAPENGARP